MQVSFPGDGVTLRGHLHVPKRAGTHPAVVWNHGSERDPATLSRLATFFTSAGYVFFAPHRRGHGASPGEYALGTFRERARSRADSPADVRRIVIELVIGLYESHLADIAQAVRWIREQPSVNGRPVAMAGVSHGGIQTVLTAEADLGPAAYIPFAPGAMAWSENAELRRRLLNAVAAARAPMFLIQAKNDYDLGPSDSLGAILREKGHPNLARVYPPYGTTHQAGHGAFACQGMSVWGGDVRAFLAPLLHSPSRSPRGVSGSAG